MSKSKWLKAAVAGLALGTSLSAERTWASSVSGQDAEGTSVVQRQRSPNVLVWMMDDVGFAQLSSYGGLVETPNIDRVAARGVRYSNYHTTPICSSSRAAFLTGRNAHTVNMGGHNAFARDIPGYSGRIPASAGTIAENLRQGGYATFALGKWDHLPIAESSPSGPFTYWPQHQGFDRFYGFVSSETDNFHPQLWRDTSIVNPSGKDYHLSSDLATEAIDMIRSRDGDARPRPFFMYWATGAAHAPHHAPQEWIDRYKGKFDMGWDKARETILAKQRALGLVDRSTQIGPRPEWMPAWDTLTGDQKRLYARQMEVFAAALSHADAQFGRILDELQQRGELDNTVIVIVSDNGASAEGGVDGTYSELFFAAGPMPSVAENLTRYSDWGGPKTYPHYAFGWAVAGNTPYRYYKQTTYEGGINVPLIISGPMTGGRNGRIDNDFVYVADIAPTILDLAGVKRADEVNGVAQSPFDGKDVAYTLTDPKAEPPVRSQYFEMFGHRAFWSDGWKIVAPARLNVWDITSPSVSNSPWQLYNLRADPGETVDLAGQQSARVDELARGFEDQAAKFNVNPIGDQREAAIGMVKKAAADFRAREGRWTYTGPISRIVKQLAPPIEKGNVTVTADLDLPTDRETGPIFALGGQHGGVGLFLSEGRLKFALRDLAGESVEVAATRAVGPGKQRVSLDIGPADGAKRTISLRYGDDPVVSKTIKMPIPVLVPETFDVGRDDGTTVSPDYAANVNFPGAIDRLTFQFQPSGQAAGQ